MINEAQLQRLSANDLLRLHAIIIEELRARGVVRSSNNPAADLAEHMFCQAFGWAQTGKSAPDADASCSAGNLYQVKARRLTRHNTSRQLGALRGLPEGGFHYLAAVLFNEDFGVAKAALVPHELVLQHATFVQRTNSWRFHLRDAVWTWAGVEDVTEQLRAVRL